MSNRSRFLFGMACGAWLNIWPAAAGHWGPFVFAYILVFISLWSVSIVDYGSRNEK